MRAKEFIIENAENKFTLADAIEDFMPLAISFLELPSIPEIKFSKDVVSKHDQPTFGCYHHSEKSKVKELDVEERNPNDIIRTLAHELVHYKQDLEGRLGKNSWKTGSPTENEAHEKAGEMMRTFNKKYPQYLNMQAVEFDEAISRRDFLKFGGAAAAGAALGGVAQAQDKTDPDKMIARISMDGDFKELDLTGKFKGDVKSQLNQASELIPNICEKNQLGQCNIEIRYQGKILRTTWSSANLGMTNENFADGKVKGKSRPGRVKRAGASCNGSVTDLRKRAKNASGEKAKMYHWCANMKSGRNK